MTYQYTAQAKFENKLKRKLKFDSVFQTHDIMVHDLHRFHKSTDVNEFFVFLQQPLLYIILIFLKKKN